MVPIAEAGGRTALQLAARAGDPLVLRRLLGERPQRLDVVCERDAGESWQAGHSLAVPDVLPGPASSVAITVCRSLKALPKGNHFGFTCGLRGFRFVWGSTIDCPPVDG